MRLNYRGQRLLVLGGSCAIGLRCIDLALESGLNVVATHASAAGRTLLSTQHPGITSVHLDWNEPMAHMLLQPALAAGVDYLIDLAQADYETLLPAADEDAAAAYLTAHTAGRLPLLKTATRIMLARRFGRLIHVSSTAAGLPAPGQGLYSAAKCAAEAMYQTLGAELGLRGVTCVNLRLGLTDAGRGQRFLDLGGHRDRLQGHIVTPDQAAGTLMFLLSDQALALNCTTITMDAGLTAQKYL